VKRVLLLAAAAAALSGLAGAARPKVCADCIKANMQRLAGDELRGRACGTADENAAAAFVAERLKAYGVSGAAADGGYLQRVEIRSPTYAGAPVLEAGGRRFLHGREILAIDAPLAVAGPIAVMAQDATPEAAAGKVAILDGPFDPKAVAALQDAGALAVVAEIPEAYLSAWGQLADRPPRGTQIVGEEAPAPPVRGMIFAKAEAVAALKTMTGQEARFSAPRGEPLARTTYNVVGVIPGGEPQRRAILLSAHYDHVGVRDGQIYHGANDDASGTAAVLEFARQLASGPRPKRTVEVALFGCEEEGGHGAKYFLAHPPRPLADLAANLEFEMIGAPDPFDRKALMLTGWERSNLGPTLRAHGASIGPDHYPQERFFERSDNYQLALKGVVAQTISAWPVPPTYHKPTDDLAHLDMPFMIEVIGSLSGPIRWLADDDFEPAWLPGMAP
jgi:hypothetical protein